MMGLTQKPDTCYKLLAAICILLLGSVSFSYGQKLNFKKYSVNDGLPQSQVHDIAQTKDGYIWMTTYGGGLTKFDGQQFVNYTTEDGLKDNAVEDILIDSSDNIWVSTSKGGVATFRGDSLVYPIENDSLNKSPLTDIEQLADGTMWFSAYQGGIFIYDGQQISRLTEADGLLSNTVWDFNEDPNGTLWMATHQGVSVYDGETFQNYSMQDGLSGRRVYEITDTKDGNKWLATSNGFTIWDGEKFNAVRTINGDSLGAVFDIIQTSDGKIWVGTESKGIYRYQNDKFRHLTTKNGLSSNYIYRFFEDRNNQLWIATDEDGVNLYRDEGFIFYTDETGLNSNGILSVYRDEEDVFWFGTMKGIQSFDGQSFREHALPGEYENQYIWNITGLPNGDKLIGMPDNTLMSYDGESYSNFSEEYNLGKLYVYDWLVDATNHLWIGAESGLYKVSLSTKEVRHYTSDDGLATDLVYTIYEDTEGKKWIGTSYGLSIFDGEEFSTVRVKDGLGHNQVYYITEDQKGDIWLGTGGGVSVYHRGDSGAPAEIHNFDKQDGMRLVTTHFLWFDKDGNLWQGTNGGLQMLNVPAYRETGNMQITHYAITSEGIGLEFNYHALTEGNDGEIWMGSMEGAVRLDADKLRRDTLPPPLNFTNISLNGLPVQWNNYRDSLVYHNGMMEFPAVTFPYGKNSYGFYFRGLSYFNPENISYRYKLQGFEEEWMPVTENNSAIYTNLSPGDYTFIVEAKGSSSNFGDSRATYDFSVAYPFWQTYWFYGLAVMGLIGLVYGYIRIRVGYLEKNRLQELVDEQTEDLQAALEEKEVLIKEIHHRVKNNLAVISGLLELQIDYASDEFASRVLQESQQRVQSISMIHEKLYQNDRLAEIDFSKYIKELVDVISYSYRQADKDIEVEISTGGIRLGVDQGIPCGLIVNELLSNAFSHAFEGREEGRIWVTFEKTDDGNIRLVVRDNGIGLPLDFEEGQSASTLGMVLVDTLVDQLGGTLTIDRLDEGTAFVIEFEKEKPPLKVPLEN